MTIAKNVLLCLLLGTSVVTMLKVCILLDQASITLADSQGVITQAGPQLVGASIELRGAAREQRTYYKATGKALAIATFNAARLIEHTDRQIGDIGDAAQNLLSHADRTLVVTTDSEVALTKSAQQVLADLDAQTKNVGSETALAMQSARQSMDHADAVIAGPIAQGAGATAQSAANIREATESIRLALEPLRKPTGRLKFVLHWLLGLPHVNIP